MRYLGILICPILGFIGGCLLADFFLAARQGNLPEVLLDGFLVLLVAWVWTRSYRSIGD